MWTGLAGVLLLFLDAHDGDNILPECCVPSQLHVQFLLHTRQLVNASLSVVFTLHCCMLALCSARLRQVRLVDLRA